MSDKKESKALRIARDATKKLLDEERTLRSRHAVLVRDRDRTWSALEPRAKIINNAEQLVDAAAARWWEHHSAAWVRSLSERREIRTDQFGVASERRHRPSVPPLPGADLSVEAICALSAPAVKSQIAAMLRAQPDSAFGPAVDERAPRLAELDREIAELERAHGEIVAGAAEFGIEIDELAPVKRRRLEADAEAARNEALAERRQRAG
jgi:hypothetical protein